MTHLPTFLAYAAAFEKTYADDDWSRLEPFFTDDVVYQVSGLPAACTLRGRAQMLAGMKKSLDGFDRRMAERRIVPTSPPTEADETVTLHGVVHYRRAGSEVGELRATIVATFTGDRISQMHDHFVLDAPAIAWLGAHATDLDGSYV